VPTKSVDTTGARDVILHHEGVMPQMRCGMAVAGQLHASASGGPMGFHFGERHPDAQQEQTHG
jgi:hypothetical protein